MNIYIRIYCGSDDWGCGALLGTYRDRFEDKYLPTCPDCEIAPYEKFAYMIAATVVL